MRLPIVLVLLTNVLQWCAGYKVLGIFPHFGFSHWLVFKPLMEELANRGHNVTVVSGFPRGKPLENYREISIEKYFPEAITYVDQVNFGDIEAGKRVSILEMFQLQRMAQASEVTLRHREVLALENEDFDLVVTELFNTNIYHALAHKIKAPVIGASSCQMLPWFAETLKTPHDPSYVPNTMGFSSPPFSFFERLVNLYEIVTCTFLYRTMINSKSQTLAEEYLGPLPDLEDLVRNVSLVLTNSHFSLNLPRPLSPNIIEVGGINISPIQPLPKDIKKILDSSTDGVIYFSFGTVLKASTLAESKTQAFIKTFSKLKQTVLWKWDSTMENKPANVHISSWFPQRDIFAHKNVVLFISHCGNLGTHEAVHEGIPIICIPILGDQPYNSKSVESQGMASILSFYSDITEEKLTSTINEMLTNPSFRDNAKRVSKAYRDRPMTPLQTAVFWVEYVLRHKGAYHLRSLARDMPWYQYTNYDIMVFIHVVLFALAYLVYKLCRAVINKCLQRGSSVSQKKQKQKKS